MDLYETLRPKTWGEIVGHEKAVGLARKVVESPNFDRGAFLILGASSGIGKSSLANVIGKALQPDDFWCERIDGQSCTIDTVRRLAQTCGTCAGGSGWRIIIVEECEKMSGAAESAWRTFLEPLPRKVCVVFTSNAADLFGGSDAPFASRCHVLPLSSQGLADKFAALLRARAQADGRDGEPAAFYKRIVQDRHNNLRRVWQDYAFGLICEAH